MSYGVVLAGGGGRSAYEMGALAELLRVLSGRGERVDVVVGTRIGSVNAGFLAGNADRCVREVVDRLVEEEPRVPLRATLAPLLRARLLFASDAGLRTARNHADARRDAAALSAPTEPHALQEVDEADEADGEVGDGPLDVTELDTFRGPQSSTVPDAPEDLR
jgi:predicted acylesterase/phospholipase RssA